MERQAFIDKVNELGQIMGYSVEIDEALYPNAFLRKEVQELRIFDRGYIRDGKLIISGNYPDSKTGESSYQKNISINVSENKTAEQISEDIARRLLPDYLPRLARAIEQNNADNEAEAEAQADIDAIKAAFPSLIVCNPKNDYSGKVRGSRVYFGEIANNTLVIASPTINRHKLELSELTTEQVIAILKVLNI